MKNVLMVLTSHDELGATGKKTGFWLEELASPYYVLLDRGFDVTLASPKGGRPPLDPKSSEPSNQTEATKRFDDDPTAQTRLGATIPLTGVRSEDFDAVFFPGGHGPMWDLATNPSAATLVTFFLATGKPVAAVCHGPAALVAAVDDEGVPIVRGRRVTGFTDSEEAGVGLTDVVPFLLEGRLRALGAMYQRGPDWQPFVVADGLLVTGQNPQSSEAVATKLADLLDEVARPAAT